MSTVPLLPPDQTASPRPGRHAALRVVGEIGRGAQADVHRVRRAGVDYAMKVLRLTGADDATQVRAFRREAALLACLDNPGLARVYEVGTTDGRPYLLMDLIEGQRLSEVLADGPLPPARVAALGADIASALAAAHGGGLVHRDVKPDNILVTADGAARLVDFGLAVRMNDETGTEVAGTLVYSSPEQAGMLNRPVDGRSDLYALGGVLYECLTGEPPFDAADLGELLRLHAVAPVPDPRTAAPAVSAAFAAVIVRLLAKDPDDRYQSGTALLADLRHILADPTGDVPLGAESGAESSDALPSGDGRPLVGREAELAALRTRWDAALTGRGGVAVVHGAPGSGKSRLVGELAGAVTRAGHVAIYAKCEPDDRQPLAPIRAAVDAHVRAVLRLPAEQAEVAVAVLRAAAGPAAGLVKNLSPALAEVLAVPDMAGGIGQDRYASAVAGFLAGLACIGAPVLLHVDDVQFCDDATARVLAQLAGEVAGVPMLVVVTAVDDGPGAAPARAITARLGLAHDTDIIVAPLDAAAVGELVMEVGGGLRMAPEVAADLALRSGGNAFTVLQYLRAIIDQGLAEPSWGRWRVDLDALDALRLPADAAQLVLLRIDALDPVSRRLLGIAAVVGPRFTVDLVAEVAAVDRQQVLDRLAGPDGHGLVQARATGGYGFLHDWIREALLGQFTDATRRDLHDRIADALDKPPSGEQPVGAQETATVYALARHCAAGDPSYRPERMLRAGHAAGALALDEHAPDAALFFLEHAAAAAAAAGLPTDSAFGQQLGTAYHQSGRFAEAMATLRRTLDATTDPRERVWTLHLIARVHDSTWGGLEQIATVEQGLTELGRPSPVNPVLLVLSSLWLFVLGSVIRLTRIGYGTARGEKRELLRLQTTLYHYGGGGSLRALRPSRALLYALRGMYPISRLGHSSERARDMVAMTMVLRLFRLNRAADRVTAAATRIAEDLADPTLSAYIQWMAATSIHGAGVDQGERLERVLAEQHRWLNAGLVLDCHAVLGQDQLLRGDMAAAQAGVARRQRWVEAGGQFERSSVIAFDAGMLAMRGRAGEAAHRMGQIDALATADHARVDRIIAQLQTAIERDDLGDSFDEAAAAFDALGLRALDLRPRQHALFVYLAYGRVEQARRAAAGSRRAAAGRRRATAGSRRVAVRAARAAVDRLGRLTHRPVLAAHHAVLEAACALLADEPRRVSGTGDGTHGGVSHARGGAMGADGGGNRARGGVGRRRRAGGPAAALAMLDAAAPLCYAVDGPLIAYEVAVLRARALTALGVTGEATRQARAAAAVAEEQGWAHRARRLVVEFGLHSGPDAPPARRSAALGGTRQSQRWAVLEQVSLAASRVLDLDRLAEIALDQTTRILGAERALLFLLDAETGVLRPHLGRDAAGHDLPELTGYSASLVDRVRHSREPLVVTGTEEGEALGAQSAVVYGLRSILVAPLQLDDRLLGVVYLDSRVAKGIFTTDDVDLLTAVTHHVAVAMETARAAQLEVAVTAANRQRDLAETLRQAMARLSDTLDPELVLRRLLATVVDTPGAAYGWLVIGAAGADRVTVLTGEEGTGTVPGEALSGLLSDRPASIRSGTPPFASVPARSWLSVPLDSRTGRLGVLVLADERPQAYAEADLGLAAALVGQAMVAYENALLFSQVNELAVTDSLTGVANRRRFFELAGRMVAHARGSGAPLSAVMVDIDHFKRVNDTYGHQVGDDVIRAVADRLQAGRPGPGLFARYGGEEFVLLLPETGETAPEVAERLRAAVAATPVPTREGPVPVTISLGLARWQPADGTADGLLARADAALYRAKQAGRNRVMDHDDVQQNAR